MYWRPSTANATGFAPTGLAPTVPPAWKSQSASRSRHPARRYCLHGCRQRPTRLPSTKPRTTALSANGNSQRICPVVASSARMNPASSVPGAMASPPRQKTCPAYSWPRACNRSSRSRGLAISRAAPRRDRARTATLKSSCPNPDRAAPLSAPAPPHPTTAVPSIVTFATV